MDKQVCEWPKTYWICHSGASFKEESNKPLQRELHCLIKKGNLSQLNFNNLQRKQLRCWFTAALNSIDNISQKKKTFSSWI